MKFKKNSRGKKLFFSCKVKNCLLVNLFKGMYKKIHKLVEGLLYNFNFST